jgi:hypothetical protein
MPFLQASGYVEDELNRRMFSADERAYLLEEIEKKDNMLSMLTEGLREVSTLCPAVLCPALLSFPLTISIANSDVNLMDSAPPLPSSLPTAHR